MPICKIIERGNIDGYNKHIHDPSLTCFTTGMSMKSVIIKVHL